MPKYTIIDYWRRCLETIQCPLLTKVIRACLTLSQGNGEVERLFSMFGDILVKIRQSLARSAKHSSLDFHQIRLDGSRKKLLQLSNHSNFAGLRLKKQTSLQKQAQRRKRSQGAKRGRRSIATPTFLAEARA